MRSGSPKHLSHGRREKWNTNGVLLPNPVGPANPVEPAGTIDTLETANPAGPTNPAELINLAEVFGNHRPVELEIGTGKGTFLLARAGARPELNFLGIEWAGAYCRYAADRVRRAGLTNVRLLHADATAVVRRRLADGAIWRAHVYFPDPWPKRRHHRRRSIQVPFVRDLARVLTPGGQLLIVTDHLEYFVHIRRTLAHVPGLAPVGWATMTDRPGEVVGTNFERKYAARGKAFFRQAVLKYQPAKPR